MPGTYEKGKFDIAGFSVGIVDQNKILDKKKIKKNNLILAIPSSGIHSNGYSLIRWLSSESAPQWIYNYDFSLVGSLIYQILNSYSLFP